MRSLAGEARQLDVTVQEASLLTIRRRFDIHPDDRPVRRIDQPGHLGPRLGSSERREPRRPSKEPVALVE